MVRSMPDDFETMWSDLAPVGGFSSFGGYFRQPWLSAERELAAWFEAQCAARGLVVERDGIGNLVAWWDPRAEIAGYESVDGDPASPRERTQLSRRDGVVTGSHLDSV